MQTSGYRRWQYPQPIGYRNCPGNRLKPRYGSHDRLRLYPVTKDIIPSIAHTTTKAPDTKQQKNPDDNPRSLVTGNPNYDAGILGLAFAAVALFICFGLSLGPLPSLIVVVLCFICTTMSAQPCGQTCIGPMEIFGLLVLLAVTALGQNTQVQLFYMAGIIAVACGLTGDVMNDLKAGKILSTSPRVQWIGRAISGLLGAVVASAVLFALLNIYGQDVSVRVKLLWQPRFP